MIVLNFFRWIIGYVVVVCFFVVGCIILGICACVRFLRYFGVKL